MKRAFIISGLGLLLFLFNCCNNEIEIPKIECTQPGLVLNQKVQKVRDLSGPVPKQYGYDDIIEAYVVSSDEGGNFFKTIFYKHCQQIKCLQ